jgi:chromosome segregation ATPase
MNKTEATVKGIKDLGGEVSAWEGRLQYLQNEAENLKRKNDQIKKEIESALALAQQELDKKREQARSELSKVTEATAKLEADRQEFQGILTMFRQEKNLFETEKTKILDINADTQKMREKMSNFILLVKREADKL